MAKGKKKVKMSKGKKAAKLSQPVKKAIKKIVKGNIETKVNDLQWGNSGAVQKTTTAGDIYYLSGIAQGTGAENRTGIKITPTRLGVRMLLRMYSSVPTNFVYYGNPVRVVIFSWDNSYQQATAPSTPLTQDLLPNIGAGADVILRYPSHIDKGTFNVLHDKVYTPTYNADRGVYVPIHIELYGKKLPGSIQYTGTSATDSSSGKNGLYMLVASLYDTVTGGVGGANAFVEYYFTSRLQYKDA